jgi:hypothetical protein
MDCLYPFLKFIIIGSVIVGVTMLAENGDPRYGKILAAAPITTPWHSSFVYCEA